MRPAGYPRGVRLSVVLFCVAALALPASVAAAPAPSAIPDCLGKPQVRPAQLVFACADANFGARGLRWIGWGSPVAAALGTGYANDCKPYCAAGTMHNYRVVVVASGSVRCPDGRRAYATAAVAFLGRSPFPKASARDMTYPLRCGPRP